MTEEKRKRGRPKGSMKKGIPEKIIDPDEIQRKIKEAKEKFKGMPRLRGRPKKVVATSYTPDNSIEVNEEMFRPENLEARLLPESEIIEIAETAKNYTPSRLKAIAEVMEDVFLAKKKIDQLKQKPAAPERSYPSNWGEMGKIAKLEWLTANPRK